MRTTIIRLRDEGPIVSFRCTPDLLESIEAEGARQRAREPGVRRTRSDVVRELLLAALRGAR